MPWQSSVPSQVLAIHAALVPTPNGDGEIVYFGGDQHFRDFNLSNTIDAARRFNCRTGAIAYVRAPLTDVFCSGHALLADGRLLVAGGTKTFPADAGGDHHDIHFPGHRRCWVYSGATGQFTEVATMNPGIGRAADDAGGGRWYPTLVTLATGEILAIGGHPDDNDVPHNNVVPERYRPLLNSWGRLPAVGEALGGPDLYPRAHLMPNGEVFISSAFSGHARCIRYHPFSGATIEVCNLPNGDYRGFGAGSILLPLLPTDGYKPRMLVCGGTTPQKITLDSGAPGWSNAGSRTGSAAGRMRRNSCTTLLPTGQVLVTGGVTGNRDGHHTDDSINSVRVPEIYDPGLDVDGQRYTGTEAWRTIEQPAAVTRNYHSTALLLPNGNVWTAGSSINAEPGDPATQGRLSIEIFEPPYPAGPRPHVSNVPGYVTYKQQFTVNSPQAASIRRVALLRCGSSTHAFDSDQRYVGLSFTRDGTTLRVTAPPNGAIAPPGCYMLFLVDDNGRPCERAAFIRVGGSMSLFTDRSEFSRQEVQALRSANPVARITDAFYVMLDGYLPADLNLPAGPDVRLVWSDNGQLVPGMSAELNDPLYEDDSRPPGLAQRITLPYIVRFDNETAFTQLGSDNQRGVTVIVRLGSVETRGRFQLYTNAFPYMRDGQTPWLSIDLRVIQRRPGMTLAGVAQGADDAAPLQFVEQVLTQFNGRPDDENHPFRARLGTDEAASTLELSSHVAAQPVYNYAFAKVRFRAPAGVNATDVRMFFRLFTTAATTMDYNASTVYRRDGNGPTARPLRGEVGGAVASIPFFASSRALQIFLPGDPLNVRTLAGAGAQEVTAYFGCWLDFNHNTELLNLIRGRHQCLVAEVHYPPHPIPFGATPADSGQLAQRNITILGSDNPGNAAAHTVQHTFELRPSAGTAPTPVVPGPGDALPREGVPNDAADEAVEDAGGAGGDVANTVDETGGHLAEAVSEDVAEDVATNVDPDQLMIRWHNMPRDTQATLYLPDVDVPSMLDLAARRPAAYSLSEVDEHTVRCRVSDITYLPLPGNRKTNIPGLISIQLPFGVRTGQRYKVTAHQISGATRKIIGSFQIDIPVSAAPQLRAPEERTLAVLKYIALSIPSGDRWYPIFQRYLTEIGDRVRAFGGDPAQIPPSPSGAPGDQPCEKPEKPTEKPCTDKTGKEKTAICVTGKVTRLFYDCFGECEGFALATCEKTWRFACCGRGLADVLWRALRDEVTVTVEAVPVDGCGEAPCRTVTVTVRRC